MTLRQKQSKFVWMVRDLLNFAEKQGYELTFGEALRTPEQAALYAKQGKGIPGSIHQLKLAIDLNLFVDGVYMTSTEAHRKLGEYWESIGGTWGGRFNDGNHYSLAHGGKK
jgi:D-alanyl-D-alanine carboxypeptidase